VSARSRDRRPAGAAPLRTLVACPVCRRQYDASRQPAGARLRCLCGARLEPPAAERAAAPVVRCASCGAPREPKAERCSHCRAPFATGERERNTLCPGCAARIADGARHCPACGLRIEPRPYELEPSTRRCPACEERARLSSRAWPDPPGNVLECTRCGGLWLSNDLFAELERRARRSALSLPAATAREPVRAAPVVYRRCPECGQPMNRRNYGGTSGVVLDRCSRHGLWFDDAELERVLGWVRSGGLELAERRRDEERNAAERRRRRARIEAAESAPSPPENLPLDDLDHLVALLGALFRGGLRLIGRLRSGG